MSDTTPDTLFAPFLQAAGLLVAVSGGPDSLALLALAADWSKGANRPPVFAATFDHGFRAASANEAKRAGDVAASLDIPHTILTWEGVKPATRIQETARAARYQALCAHAQAIGADVLLTGHHADDQAETILFRMMRGSSIAGLAGMRARRNLGPLLHARPLLGLRKAELIAMCEARGLPFVTDPANSDPRFARTGLRDLLPVLETAGMGAAAFGRLAARAARAEDALAHSAQALRVAARLESSDSETRLDARALACAPEELALRVLMGEIARLGQAPRLEKAEPLALTIWRHASVGTPCRLTLGGTILDLRVDAVLVICPEQPRRRPI